MCIKRYGEGHSFVGIEREREAKEKGNKLKTKSLTLRIYEIKKKRMKKN